MWTATVDKINRAGVDIRIDVTYTDGTAVIKETLAATSPQILKQTVINRVRQLEQGDSFLQTEKPGPVDTTIPPPVTPPAPTADELARQSYAQDLRKMVALKNMVNLGVLTGSEAVYTNLLAKLKSNLKPEYWDLF